MSTSLETMKNLITQMKQEFDEMGTKGLQENRRLFDATGLKTPLPESIHLESIAINADITADWLIPTIESPVNHGKIILFFHGGGFSAGSSISHRPLCARIAQHTNCKVLSVNYRLAPEHKYPIALEDAVQSYQWLLEKYSANQIIIMGDSAGGGLAIASLFAIREKGLPMPAGAVGLSAWLDLECTSKSYQTHKSIDLLANAEGLRFVGRGYANKQINTNPLVSPFYAKDLTGLCPLLIQIGGAETLLDENIAFAECAKRDGVKVELQVWPNMVHVWHSLYGLIPEAKESIDTMGKWIRSLN